MNFLDEPGEQGLSAEEVEIAHLRAEVERLTRLHQADAKRLDELVGLAGDLVRAIDERDAARAEVARLKRKGSGETMVAVDVPAHAGGLT